MAEETEVRFDGAAGGTAPLTWAQRQVWDWIHADFDEGRHGHLNAALVVAPPPATRVAKVLDAIHGVLVAQEALRTRYRLAAMGNPEQVVAESGAVPAELVSAPADATETATETMAADVRARYLRRGIDVVREWPLLIGIVTANGWARQVVLVVSRMVVDAWGADILEGYLKAALAAAADGRARPEVPDGRQPLAQAAFEQTPAGLRISAASQRHWREQLMTGPQLTVPLLDRAIPATQDRIQRVVMRSAAIGRSLAVLTHRHRVPSSAVVLAAVAASLNTYTGLHAGTFMLHCGNRVRPELRSVVGCLKQHTLITITTAAGTSFSELIERSANALLSGFRHGQYDNRAVADLMAEVHRERGIDVARSAGFNQVATPRQSHHPQRGSSGYCRRRPSKVTR